MSRSHVVINLVALLLFICSCNNNKNRISTEEGALSNQTGLDSLNFNSSSLDKFDDTLHLQNKAFIITIEKDTMNFEEDASFGVGDDDAFTAEDFKIYRIFDGISYDLSNKLNDYNLTTSVTNKFNIRDTFIIVVYFPGLGNKMKQDTNVIVEKLLVFNGDRNNYNDWKKSGGIKKMSLGINQEIIDTVALANTYKMQIVDFSFKPLYNKSGNSDTIKIVVEDIYPGTNNNTYSISELKLDAKRLY